MAKMAFEGMFKQLGWYQLWHNEHHDFFIVCRPAHTMDTDSGLSELRVTQFWLYFEF